MYDSGREVRREITPAYVWQNGRETIERQTPDRLGAPGDGDGRRWLDALGDGSARALPCGGRCERFGAQGCHSSRCRVGGQ
jgi:hypothetical protein